MHTSCIDENNMLLLTCSACHEVKEALEFRKDKRTKTGFTSTCKACLNAKAKEVHNKRYKEDEEFRSMVNDRNASYRKIHKNEPGFMEKAKVRNKQYHDSHKDDSEFKAHKRNTSKSWYEKNKYSPEYTARFSDPVFIENFNAGQRKRYQNDKLKRRAKKYGTTVSQIEKDLSECKGKCPILGLSFDLCGGWVVDHCHGTGVYRGIISNDANLAAAFLHNSMEASLSLAKYLERNLLFSTAS